MAGQISVEVAMKRVTRSVVVAVEVAAATGAFGFGFAVPLGAARTARVASANCQPSQLRVSVARPQGTAGTIYYPIVFTNRGGACWIWGVPGIQSVVGAKRNPLGPRATNESLGQMPARHLLHHGTAVSVGYGVAESGNYPGATCRARNASGVLVTLAPFIRPTYLALRISVCTRLASTHTQLLVVGRTGA
ncbi:MAG: DUF4232 domain-containing protein [Acidimicrobiales bacterium]